MAIRTKVGSENGPALTDTGPQQLAITDQVQKGLPKPKRGNSKTRLVSGTKRGKGARF